MNSHQGLTLRERSGGAPALEAHGLVKRYKSRGRSITAVDGVSFSVQRGEIVGLLGPNGAGKTTAIKCLLNLIPPTAGQVRIAGFDPGRRPAEALRRVGAVLEGSRNVYWRLSPLENLIYFANLHNFPRRSARRRAEELLELFGLGGAKNRPVGELSRGMQQKVAVCAALIRDPQVLILDEPTLGLDVETERDLRRILVRTAREEGRAVVVSSHELPLIEAVCDRVIIINSGRVVADDAVARLLEVFRARSYRLRLMDPVSGELAERLRGAFPHIEFGLFPGPEGGEDALPRDGELNANEFSVHLSAPEDLYPLMESLQSAGAVVDWIDRRDPDLEEIFLRLVRQPAEAAGASAAPSKGGGWM